MFIRFSNLSTESLNTLLKNADLREFSPRQLHALKSELASRLIKAPSRPIETVREPITREQLKITKRKNTLYLNLVGQRFVVREIRESIKILVDMAFSAQASDLIILTDGHSPMRDQLMAQYHFVPSAKIKGRYELSAA